MIAWPTPLIPPCVTIHTFSLECMGGKISCHGVSATSATSGAFPIANRAYHFPFQVCTSFNLVQFFCYNGATVDGTGKIDMGVYSLDGRLIVSTGGVVQAGTNALQGIAVASTLLGPGMYYMALASDNNTNTVFRISPGTNYGRSMGQTQQATAFPLPATFSISATTASYLPIFGLSSRSLL